MKLLLISGRKVFSGKKKFGYKGHRESHIAQCAKVVLDHNCVFSQ